MKKLFALTCAIAFTGMAYSADNSDILDINVRVSLSDELPRSFMTLTIPIESSQTVGYLIDAIKSEMPDYALTQLSFGGSTWYKLNAKGENTEQGKFDTKIGQTGLSKHNNRARAIVIKESDVPINISGRSIKG